MRVEKRLQRIETSLTPKQSVLLWLKETTELGYVKHSVKLLESSRPQRPRAQISQTVANAVRAGLSGGGMRIERVDRVVREAQKEADFLVVLVRDLRSEVQSACTFHLPYELLLHEKLERMLEQIIHGGGFKKTTWDLWRMVLKQRLEEMWLMREIVKEISKKYFDSHNLLFPEHEILLNEQICSLEGLTKHCNTCYRHYARQTGIKLNAILCSVREQISIGVGERVARAKSTVLEDFGESDAAAKVMEPYTSATLEHLRTLTDPGGATS